MLNKYALINYDISEYPIDDLDGAIDILKKIIINSSDENPFAPEFIKWYGCNVDIHIPGVVKLYLKLDENADICMLNWWYEIKYNNHVIPADIKFITQEEYLQS